MTSKNLFFKLMKEDLKRRIWAAALISLGFFLFYPVVAAFTAGEIREHMDYAKGLAEYEDGLIRWLSFNCGMTVFLMIAAALICGLSSFSFLNSKSKVDFYHGIPVRREKLFAANFLDGILLLAVPYGIAQVLAVLVGILNGADGSRLWQVAIAAYGLHVTYYILMYSTVVVAAMMTGHLVVGFLGTIVFASYMPMAVGLLVGYLSSFFRTYSSAMPGLLSEHILMYGIRLSPIAEYIYQLERNGEQYLNPVSMAVPMLAAWTASVLLAVLSCFLYRRRPSEAAGRAMAFSVSRPVIRILLTVASALGLGLFFYSVRYSMGWAFFGIVFGGGICHCVVEIIYHFDFRKLFSHKLQLMACLAVSAVTLMVFRYDLLGYDRYLPKTGQVREASIQVQGITDWVSYGHTKQFTDGHYEWAHENADDYIFQNMSYHDIENLLAIASEGVEQTEKRKEAFLTNGRYYPNGYSYHDGEDSQEEHLWSWVNICYTMKSGRKVSRMYYMPIDGKMAPAVERLYGDEEFQKGCFPLLNMTADQVSSVRYRGKYSTGEYDEDELCLDELTDARKAQLLEAYQKEFAAMTVERMEKEAPVALLRFCEETDEAGMRWWKQQEANRFRDYPMYRYRGWRDLVNKNYYPVYPSFVETIRLLEEQGAGVGGYLDGLKVSAIQVWNEITYEERPDYAIDEDFYQTDDGASRECFYIRDPRQIQELREILIYTGLGYYDPFLQKEDLEVSLMIWDPEKEEARDHVEESEEGNWNASVEVVFPKGQVPDFLREEMES